MSLIKMPEGVEIDVVVYLVGIVDGQEIETVIAARGLPAFGDSVLADMDVAYLVKSYRLDDLGTDWRVMTREEIKDYKRRDADERAEVEF